MKSHELIDIRETTIPFWQMKQIKDAIRAIRTYEYIIAQNVSQYRKYTQINPIDQKIMMEMESIMSSMEYLGLNYQDHHKATQRNLNLANIEKALMKFLPANDF